MVGMLSEQDRAESATGHGRSKIMM